MNELWIENHPKKFWQFQVDLPAELWGEALMTSMDLLGTDFNICSIDDLLSFTLGEKRFGANHWSLGVTKKIYYIVKPYLPRAFRVAMRKQVQNKTRWQEYQQFWPIDYRYVHFLWKFAISVMDLAKIASVPMKPFWPNGKYYCLVLTHDVEGREGYRKINRLIEIEENFGFRSSFNVVPEAYPIDHDFMEGLKENGFEIGIHGLKHDGKLFFSKKVFSVRAEKINKYLKAYHAVGFRAPLTHRHPKWMQELDIEYDSSFFDTDPFEPIPGGVMTIWPFFIGKFVELPMTLAQDHTLKVLDLNINDIWWRKVEWIKLFHGMVLVNTHPDYFTDKCDFERYEALLTRFSNDPRLWHANPRDVAKWWRMRHAEEFGKDELISLSMNELVDTINKSIRLHEGVDSFEHLNR